MDYYSYNIENVPQTNHTGVILLIIVIIFAVVIVGYAVYSYTSTSKRHHNNRGKKQKLSISSTTLEGKGSGLTIHNYANPALKVNYILVNPCL